MRTRKLQSLEGNCGKRSNEQEPKRKESPRWEGKWENVISGKLFQFRSWACIWQQIRGSATNRTFVLSRTRYEGQDRRAKPLQKVQATEDKSPWERRRQIPLPKNLWKKKTLCNHWHPSESKITSLAQDAFFGKRCRLRHVEAEEQSSKKSKKGGVKGSVALLREYILFGCVSRDSHPRKRKLGSNHAVKFSRITWHQIKIRERKGPSWEIIPKREPLERTQSLRAQFWGEVTRDHLATKKMRQQSSMGLGEKYLQAQKVRTKPRSTLILKPGQRQRPRQNLQRNENSQSIPELQHTRKAKRIWDQM